MHVILSWGAPGTEATIQKIFKAGKPILAQSDTVWGLFIPATAAGACILDTIKKRRDKPYLVIMNSLATVERVATFPSPAAYVLAQKGWPAPLTLLLPARQGQLLDAQSPSGVLGIRVPNHMPLLNLSKACGPLFSTSANIAGEQVPTTYEQIDPSILQAVGVIVYNDPAYVASSKPSTIVDCAGAVPIIVREGAYQLVKP